MKVISGNLVVMALEQEFDVIAQGNNCFCKQKSGIAEQFVYYWNTDKYPMEADRYISSYNKLGTIDYREFGSPFKNGSRQVHKLYVVNCYTQYRYGRNHSDGDNDPFDAEAIIMCLRKIAHDFPASKIGLPYIGCGLASPPELRAARRDWFESEVAKIFEGCDVTIVNYG
jgi:O-acetyl-ADP-ribose deacetylase (regulator of RNase III)